MRELMLKEFSFLGEESLHLQLSDLRIWEGWRMAEWMAGRLNLDFPARQHLNQLETHEITNAALTSEVWSSHMEIFKFFTWCPLQLTNNVAHNADLSFSPGVGFSKHSHCLLLQTLSNVQRTRSTAHHLYWLTEKHTSQFWSVLLCCRVNKHILNWEYNHECGSVSNLKLTGLSWSIWPGCRPQRNCPRPTISSCPNLDTLIPATLSNACQTAVLCRVQHFQYLFL